MKRNEVKKEKGVIAIYHVVFKRETFEDAVNAIVSLAWNAQQKFPGQDRHLFFDIDGHREKDGALDPDMWEFVSDFMLDMKDRNPIKGGFKRFFKEWSVPGPGNQGYRGTNDRQDNEPPERIEIK